MKTTLGKLGSSWIVLTALALGVGAAARAGDVVVDNLTVNFNLAVKAASTNTTAPTDGLVFYYSFGTNAVPVQDDSGNGYTGTPYGDATYSGSGVAGGGFAFDGSGDFLDLSNSAALRPAAITISAWVFPTGMVGITGTVCGRWDSAGGVNMRCYVMEKTAAGKLSFRLTASGSSDGHCAYTASNVATDRWQHVVGVWNGSQIQLYLDGQADGAPVSHTGLHASSNSTTLGAVAGRVGIDPACSLFKGRLDEVRFYNRALTTEEILALYYSIAQPTNGTVRFETGVGYLTPLGDVSMGVYTNQP